MISRRHFLQATAVSTAGLSRIASGEESSNNCDPQPPAIAKLSSLKDQARPITAEERGARQERARRLMQANRIDALLLMSGTSLEYFSGVKWWPSERTFAMILPASGKPFFVCPAFEQARVGATGEQPAGNERGHKGLAGRREPVSKTRTGPSRSGPRNRNSGDRRKRTFCFQQCNFASGAANQNGQRDTGDCGLSDDQKRA